MVLQSPVCVWELGAEGILDFEVLRGFRFGGGWVVVAKSTGVRLWGFGLMISLCILSFKVWFVRFTHRGVGGSGVGGLNTYNTDLIRPV